MGTYVIINMHNNVTVYHLWYYRLGYYSWPNRTSFGRSLCNNIQKGL